MLLQPAYKAGVIFDGFPRTLVQAEAISESFPIDLVLQFHLPRDLLIKKLMGRRVCPKCGRSYNVTSIIDHEYNLPPLLPKEENHCDNCHEELIVRSDDSLEVIENRLKVYEAQTAPLLKYYGIEGKSNHKCSVKNRSFAKVRCKERCCGCSRHSKVDDGSFYIKAVI